MMKRAVFIFVSLSLLLGCINNDQPDQIRFEKAHLSFMPSNLTITIEKADTPEKAARGLMFRTALGENEGMLFDFNQTAYQSFWMVNTKIPLEVIFVDGTFTIMDIQEMEPCSDPGTETRMPNCTIYISKWPIVYAIEVNQDFSKRYGIKEGDRIEIR